MKGFKKLALASAICSAPMAASALEAIEDEALSEVTGQDGITITASASLNNMNIRIEDDDGVGAPGGGGSAYSNAGVLMINNMSVSGNMIVNIDSGGSTASNTGNGMLNVLIRTTSATDIILDEIQVADSNGNGDWGTGADVVTFAAATTISIASGMLVDVELGSEEHNFATINGNIGTVSIGTDDTATAMTIADANGSNITMNYVEVGGINMVDATANVVGAGLQINTGTGLTAVTLYARDVTLGTQPALGDVYVSGLNLSNNTITISGH